MKANLFAVLLVTLSPTPSAAQFLDLGGPIQESDLLYLSDQPRQALDILRDRLEADSTDVDALWRAARASIVIGIDEEGSRVQNLWLDPALHWARRAVDLRPGDIDAHYWRGVAAGRRAMNAGPGYAVELAQIVYDDANTILAVDSLHGGAHNMLGKLNYEIMDLSRVKRWTARTFLGNDALDDTSWEKAEYHLAKAAESWPDFVLFHFDLAQLYKRRDREEEAVASYRVALSLQAVHPTDHALQAQARLQLEEWGVEASPESGADPTVGASRDR